MSHAGFSNRRVAGQMGIYRYHSVIDHLMQLLQVTRMIDQFRGLAGPAKLHIERIAWCARRNRFATSARVRDELNFGGHVSVRTVIRQLNEPYLHARRPIKHHYVIGGQDGICHVTISIGIFVIGNESIGQTKVNFYCMP